MGKEYQIATMLVGTLVALALAKNQPTVQLPNTTIYGSHAYVNYSNALVEQFLGIPYAVPPIGELRFMPTVDLESLPPNLNATKFGPGCMQEFGMFTEETSDFSEDCLILNIWRKSGTKKGDMKPVILILHGGGYTAGDGSEIDWRGLQLAEWGDVVVVNLNYRLGIFGFLDLGIVGANGNMGHLDQLAAMRWVQRNIVHFGGDPDRVTLFGVSAGSLSISSHLMSQCSAGLFHAAIMDAGVITSGQAELVQDSTERAGRIAQSIGCLEVINSIDAEDDILSCLKNVSAAQLVELQQNFSVSQTYTFRPTFPNDFLRFAPEEMLNSKGELFNKVPIIIGDSAKEGTFLMTKRIHDPLPLLETVEETLEWNDMIAGFHKVEDKYVKENVVNSYNISENEGVYFYRNSSSDFVGDGLFVCPVNNFAHHYSKQATTFLYRWERLTNQIVAEDPMVFGAYHGTPFYHMVGSQFAYFGVGIDPEDAAYARDALDMIVEFAKTLKQPSFRGIPLPVYKQTERKMFVFADKPHVMEGHPRDKQCDSVWPFYKNFKRLNFEVKREL